MKNLLIILATFFSVLQMYSQEVCASKTEKLVDVNAINKCAVEKGEKDNSKTITVSSKRYLKKRAHLNKIVMLSSSLKTNTISKVETNNELNVSVLLEEYRGVSFDAVETIPLFASCEGNALDKTDCFNYEMQKHIVKHFVYPAKALERGVEGDLKVSFVIGISGKVGNVKINGANNNQLLKKEAKRIVMLLPRFIPGKEKGVKTKVSYSFPMSFTLE
ncbi:energy transducer TonB [Tenacibaculum haliotis]|uniref:energy transducer TonB n=1 Tax=Tenacibaculum haliotis TaxID=1888914 RepID=UPI0021AEEFE2|nr:energy transducer TonB [Tenacibaculum haliotis]MCT4699961.1 energy transducer TonB [Tenacibaculum haliotis]